MAANVTKIADTKKGEYPVRLLKDSSPDMPALYMDIYVEGNSYEQQMFARMFAGTSCKGVSSPELADLVIFTGGPDVDPGFYGEMKHPSTHTSPERDKKDLKTWVTCVEQGIPMLGICRGAQFGHVMMGGKLYQHVDGHNQDHNIFDIRNNTSLQASSVHHQMVIKNEEGGMVVIADNYGKAQTRWRNPIVKETGSKQDVEAFWYSDTAFLGIQGHPEYAGYDDFRYWTIKLIEDLIWSNPDIVLQGSCRRLTKAHRDMAKLKNLQLNATRSVN